MKQSAKLFIYSMVIASFMVLPVYLGGCSDNVMYPTVAGVNKARASDIEQRTQIADALAKLMTDQHSEMTPAVAEALRLMNQQYLTVSSELRALAEETQVEGLDISGTEGVMAMIIAAFPGVGLWVREKNKPSRSAGDVEKLKLKADDAKEKMHALELLLAIAGDAGERSPIGGTV